MKRIFFAAFAALALSGCADAVAPAGRSADGTEPLLAPFYAPRDSIYTSQTPSDFLDASPGWQVATRFVPDYEGRVVGYRFYKAPDETGSHTARLYDASGSLIHSKAFSSETASGWQRVTFSEFVNLYAGDTYYVTVNTNSKQAKTFAYFGGGNINRNWGYAFGGAYGSTVNSFPGTDSGSSFFVDVYFRAVLCDEIVTENCM